MAMGVAAPGELRGTLEVPVVKDIIVKDIGVPAAVGSITAWYNIAHRTRTSLKSPRLDRRPRAIAHGVRAVARHYLASSKTSASVQTAVQTAAPGRQQSQGRVVFGGPREATDGGPESAKFVANANKSVLGAPRVSRG